MRIVIQRTQQASVTINGHKNAEIGEGLLILLGVCHSDSEEDAEWLCHKVAGLRIFDDANGVMNLNITDVGGDILVISQFTLMASYKKGNRPSYVNAADHTKAVPLYKMFCERLSLLIGKPVATGVFGADMKVGLLNNGPVTICMDSKNKE